MISKENSLIHHMKKIFFQILGKQKVRWRHMSFGIFGEDFLVFKGMMFNWNIDFIHSLFQKVLFINLEREPLYNIDSLLHARESFFGSLDNWYSFKPPEYYALKGKKPIEQVAGQVLFTNKAIEQQFQRIPD
jgi:K+-transporting ATPase A subunit